MWYIVRFPYKNVCLHAIPNILDIARNLRHKVY